MPAAHRAYHLMLLGSPPDMVHGAPSHRAHPLHAKQRTLSALSGNMAACVPRKQLWYIIIQSRADCKAGTNIAQSLCQEPRHGML